MWMGFRDRGQRGGAEELGDLLKSWDIFNLPPLLARCITYMDGYHIYIDSMKSVIFKLCRLSRIRIFPDYLFCAYTY